MLRVVEPGNSKNKRETSGSGMKVATDLTRMLGEAGPLRLAVGADARLHDSVEPGSICKLTERREK